MSIVVENIVSFIVLCPRHAGKGNPLLRIAPSSRVFFCLLLLLLSTHQPINPLRAQKVDTLKSTTLDEVSISAQRTPSVLKTAAPTQVVDAEKLEHMGSLQLSDALKQMAGVTLKDYGGVGGIKTVSARGLGSQFSAVTIDGIPVDDSQNGQVDLGRYLLGNSAYVSLSHGQEQGSLLSARAYAAGNTLNMETAEPQFWPGEHIKIKVGSEVGSFGLLSPSILWEQRWNKKLKSSLFVNYLRSNGNYPFTPYEGASEKIRREHSAVWMTTLDGNLFYNIAKDNLLSIKLHHIGGEHELPGPLHQHSQVLSGQSSNERQTFAQARWRIEREKWKFQLLGKLCSNYDAFRDTTPGTFADNDYRQREAYVSSSFSRHLTSWLELDLAADGSLSGLVSTQQNQNTTLRDTLTDVVRRNLAAVAALLSRFSIHNAQFTLRANAVYSYIADRVAGHSKSPSYQRLTPFLSLMCLLGENTSLRAFYKESYRAPNFGELYFFQLMFKQLRPEHAHQLNLGITHSGSYQPINLSTYQLTLDAYYNRVTDKLVAYPAHSMYYWTTDNLGRVDILGIDVTTDFAFYIQHSTFNIHLNYSYQHAVDKSDETSKFYGHQIVYTPRHSGGGSLRWENPWINLGLTAMVVGERYSTQQNLDKWRLPAYCDLGFSVDRKFDLRVGSLNLRLQVFNLLDIQYEVVRSYPMMGRNWRAAITYEF